MRSSREGVQTLSHSSGLENYQVLRDDKKWGVSEIAEKLGITKASSFSTFSYYARAEHCKNPARGYRNSLLSCQYQNSCCPMTHLQKSVKRTAGNQRKIIRKF